MPTGLKTASWISAMGMVASCYGSFIIPAIVSSILGEAEVDSYAAGGDGLSTMVFYGFLLIVPIFQALCIIFGIISAVTKNPGALKTDRLIMLVVKLSLIPFFIGGGLTIAMFLIIGIHPVLAALGWGGALILGICGWLTVVSGSMWSIATAVQLRREGRISAGEMTVHIILQFFFVADVIDAIVLFVRSAPPEPVVYAEP